MKSGDPRREWSEFKKGLGISVSQLPDGSSSSGSGTGDEYDKICLLFFNYQNYEHECVVYCIDVNSSSSTPSDIRVRTLEPVIRWRARELGEPYAYVILGSKLYMFCLGLEEHNEFFYYDMKSALSSSTCEKPAFLHRKSFVEGPPMKSSKDMPVSAVIGDSRIIVFSYTIYSYSRHSFELLDTRRLPLEWKSLPELPIKNYDENESVCIIKSHCVHGSCLIIKTAQEGIFGINVAHPEPEWVSLDSSGGGKKRFPFKVFSMVDNVMFDPYCAMRWGDRRSYPIQIRSPADETTEEFIIRQFDPYLRHCFDDRCNNLYVVEYVFPFLLFHFVKFDDAAALQSDLSNWKNIQSHKSSSFVLTYGDSRFVLQACYPIKTSDIYKSIEQENETLRKKMKSMAQKERRRKRQMTFQWPVFRTTSLLLKKKKKKKKKEIRFSSNSARV